MFRGCGLFKCLWMEMLGVSGWWHSWWFGHLVRRLLCVGSCTKQKSFGCQEPNFVWYSCYWNIIAFLGWDRWARICWQWQALLSSSSWLLSLRMRNVVRQWGMTVNIDTRWFILGVRTHCRVCSLNIIQSTLATSSGLKTIAIIRDTYKSSNATFMPHVKLRRVGSQKRRDSRGSDAARLFQKPARMLLLPITCWYGVTGPGCGCCLCGRWLLWGGEWSCSGAQVSCLRLPILPGTERDRQPWK